MLAPNAFDWVVHVTPSGEVAGDAWDPTASSLPSPGDQATSLIALAPKVLVRVVNTDAV